MTRFQRGDRVRCNETGTVQGKPHLLEGKIYTVLRSNEDYTYVDCCEQHVRNESGWFTSRFELVTEKKIDFTLFGNATRIMQEKLLTGE